MKVKVKKKMSSKVVWKLNQDHGCLRGKKAGYIFNQSNNKYL